MGTLHLRDVPEDVLAELRRLAEREGTTASAVAVRELTAAVSGRANRVELDALPDLAVTPDAIVADIERGRGER